MRAKPPHQGMGFRHGDTQGVAHLGLHHTEISDDLPCVLRSAEQTQGVRHRRERQTHEGVAGRDRGGISAVAVADPARYSNPEAAREKAGCGRTWQKAALQSAR
jgi:hypothetical protein